MLRLSIALVAAVWATVSHAAECSVSLRDQWSTAFAEMIEYNRQVSKKRDMGEGYDSKILCQASTKMPAWLQIAKEYYPACDPMSAARDLADVERINALAQRYIKLRCSKSGPTQSARNQVP